MANETNYSGLRKFAVKHRRSSWYSKFCSLYDAGDLTATRRRVVREETLFTLLKPFIQYVEGRVGPQITKSELFTLRHPEHKNICVECGSHTRQDGFAAVPLCDSQCLREHWAKSRSATCVQRYGETNPSRVKSFQKKREKTFLRNHGVTNPFASKAVQKKIKKTTLLRFGVSNVSLDEGVKAKKTQTSLRKFGTRHWTQCEKMKHKLKPFDSEMMDKAKATMKKRYGCTNPFDDLEFQELARHTVKERYGVDNVFANKSIQEQIRKTCLERYGVENPGVLFNGWIRRLVTDKFGFDHYVMGHEDIMIKDLNKMRSVTKIVTSSKTTARFRYKYGGKERNYYPDFRVHQADGSVHIIEVKSEYTLNIDLEMNLKKFATATNSCEKKKATFWVCVWHKGSWIRAKNPRTLGDLRKAGLPVSRHLQKDL